MSAVSVKAAIAPLFLLSGMVTGCTTSIAGSYDGDLECDFGDLVMEIDIEKDGDVYSGDGEISDFTMYGYPATLSFDLEVEKDKLSGEQDLDVSLDDCELTLYGYGSGSVDCEDPDDVVWDGADQMEGEINDFLGSGYDCEFQIER